MSKLDITLFNENQNHKIAINYYNELKTFFEECILSYNKFWLDKRNFYIEKKNKIINIMNKLNKDNNNIVKFMFNGKKYCINKNSKHNEQKNIKLTELYNQLIIKLENKILSLDKAINMCKKTNIKNTITLLNNYVDEELKKVKKECIKLYSKEYLQNYIKQNKINSTNNFLLRDDLIYSILIKHYNELIQPGITLLISKFN